MKYWYLLFFVSVQFSALAQAPVYPYYRPGDLEANQRLRSDILRQDSSDTHTALRSYTVVQEDSVEMRRGLFGVFYKNPDMLFGVHHKDYSFGINVLFDFNLGQDFYSDETIFRNKRGMELFGELDDRFYFYSAYEENQSNFLSYRQPFLDTYKAIRGKGNYKDYQSRVFDQVTGYDYGFATAYLGYKLSKHTRLEIGHNQYFIGNGIRSLLLSDTGNNYFNVRFQAKFWKIHYQSIFAELSSISARYNRNNQLLPKKYMVNHYLSLKPHKNIEVGIFEAIIFSRENHFELQYLNPVIFYRTLEHQLDSPDNVLLGANGKWNFFKTVSLYGQFLLDEFRVNEFFSGDGWWGNKYALQLGLNYINVLGISQLDTQLEYNRVRPFTYSHWKRIEDFNELTVSNYSHFNQPLAHPLGANFTELIFNLRYRPISRLLCEARFLYTKQGLNDDNNYGSDILIDNVNRLSDYDQFQNQGLLSTIKSTRLSISYEITNKLYIDLNVLLRTDATSNHTITNNFLGTGLRYNTSKRFVDY